jgi:uncharacterized protein involved in exopolysaccharide biosynthesis
VRVDDLPPTHFVVPDHPPAPPRLGLLEAVRRSAWLVLIPVLLFAGGAAAYGLLREPTYTSEARLNVGGLNLTLQSIDNYTAAVAQLAVAYSRAIDATAVIRPAARESGLSQREVARRISATPVQGSPVIRVRATGDDGEEARALADAAATALTEYAVELNSGTDQSQPLLRRYEAASRAYRRARFATTELAADDPDRRRAEVREDIARLKQQVAGALYQQSLAGQATTGLVQRLAPAAPATDDRWSVMQQLLAAAAIAGLLVGLGLAVWRSNRVALRRFGGT